MDLIVQMKMSDLSYFTKLITLKISLSQDWKLNALSSLTHLRHLYIHDVSPNLSLPCHKSNLANLPELELLVIKNGCDFDIKWETLPKLRKLYLGDCELRKPSKICLVANLEILSLVRQDFISEENIKNMKKLTHLNLWDNSTISKEVIHALPNLRVIGLRITSLIKIEDLLINTGSIELVDLYGFTPTEPKLIYSTVCDISTHLKFCCGLFDYIFEEPFR
jgi:hypothetical protein